MIVFDFFVYSKRALTVFKPVESGFVYETIRALMQRGRKVGFDVGGYGGCQAIMLDGETGVYYGASESRKDGQASGY